MDNSNQMPILAKNKAGKTYLFMANRLSHVEPSDAADGCVVYMIDGKEMWCNGFTAEDIYDSIPASKAMPQ